MVRIIYHLKQMLLSKNGGAGCVCEKKRGGKKIKPQYELRVDCKRRNSHQVHNLNLGILQLAPRAQPHGRHGLVTTTPRLGATVSELEPPVALAGTAPPQAAAAASSAALCPPAAPVAREGAGEEAERSARCPLPAAARCPPRGRCPPCPAQPSESCLRPRPRARSRRPADPAGRGVQPVSAAPHRRSPAPAAPARREGCLLPQGGQRRPRALHSRGVPGRGTARRSATPGPLPVLLPLLAPPAPRGSPRLPRGCRSLPQQAARRQPPPEGRALLLGGLAPAVVVQAPGTAQPSPGWAGRSGAQPGAPPRFRAALPVPFRPAVLSVPTGFASPAAVSTWGRRGLSAPESGCVLPVTWAAGRLCVPFPPAPSPRWWRLPAVNQPVPSAPSAPPARS